MQRIKEDSASSSAESLCPHAERELAAFARAVQELFGPEQARQAIEDWIEKLELTDCRIPEAVRDWRGLTIAAAVRLASRTNGLPQDQPYVRSETPKARPSPENPGGTLSG